MPECSELSKTIKDIAENIGSREGVNNIDDILKIMKKDIPLLTRDFLVDAIVEATAGEKKAVDALAQKLNEIKREARTDKATRQKIAELEQHLKAETFGTAAKKKTTTTEAVKKLRAVRDQLKKELAKTTAAQKHRQKQQEPKNIKSLKDQIKVLEKHLKDGTLPRRAKQKGFKASDVVEGLRILRDRLKKEISQSEPAKIKRLEDSIAELTRRINTGDIFPKPKAVVAESKELERLRFEKYKLQQQIRASINALKPKSIWEHIAEPFNAARAIITSVDLSAVLRQGGFVVFSRPGRALKSIPAMFNALVSEQKAVQINNQIQERPNAPLYAKSKLFLAPIDGSHKLSEMEEVFMSKWVEKIPLIRASERAYITFLNKLRADSFDTMAATLSADGSVNQKEADAIAKFINIATGRGQLGAMESAAVPLNTIFFAPRYVASRFQLLLGKPLWGGTAATRKMIAKEYGRYLIGMSLVYALGMAAGGDTEDDPRSSDFGKIRFGRTRVDPLSGISQTAVLLSRLATGQTKSVSGKVQDIRGADRPYGGFSSFDVATRFLRGKFSPMIGTAADIVTGESVVGEKVTPLTVARNLTIPLSMRDTYEVMIDQGVPAGTALSMLAIFGMGLQTYGPEIREGSGNTIKPKKTKAKIIKAKKVPVRKFGRNQ